MSIMTTAQKASYDALAAQLGSVYLLVTAAFTTGTTQPASIADALMTGQTAGGAAGPGQGGTQGIVAGSFASSGAETGTGSGQGGLTSAASSAQPYNATDFPGGQFAAPLLKANGEPVALLDALTTAGASFPASVAAPVVVFWAYRSDLGANAKWRTFFYFRNQATGNWTAFTPNASLANVSLYAPRVLLQSAQPTAAGLGNSLATAGAAEVEFGTTGDLVNVGTTASAGATGKAMDAGSTLALPYSTIATQINAATTQGFYPFFWWKSSTSGGTTGTIFLQMLPSTAGQANEQQAQYVVPPGGGTIGLLGFIYSAGALATADTTITIQVNSSPTTITCTVAHTTATGSDNTHFVAVNGGDLVSCKSVTSASDGSISRPTATLCFKPAW